MALQWTDPTPAVFSHRTPLLITAQKATPGGSAQMSLQASVIAEGPTPTDEELLEWYGVLYNALRADGWSLDLRFEQATTVQRQITETGE
ncbi:hypothetical protein RFN58_06770 [Streptomyces iakyrus]|uniref:hypothetical protein n=1 Tax=Streptomyces iakyrus TaxID=68219 RepID=UPI00052479E9|nr:hypothetical protein [Streptomyces iakyrus]